MKNKISLRRSLKTANKAEENPKKKDGWEILAALTPLILGLAVTGVGAIFTHLYNQRQLEFNQLKNEREIQLNQIQALDKLRPLLTSENPQDREFAYSSFVLMGYEKVVLKMISSTKDPSGKSVAEDLLKSSDETIRNSAQQTLDVLTKADMIVNQNETGNPNIRGDYGDNRKESVNIANNLGIKTELGRAVIQDTLTHTGRVQEFADAADTALSKTLKNGASEKEWLVAFLQARRAKFQKRGGIAEKATTDRVNKFMDLIKLEDWDLKTIQSPN